MNPLHRLKTLLFVLLCLFVVQGCTKTDASQAQSEASAEAGDIQYFSPGPNVFAGSHILVAYSGAARADSAIVRTKEEALAKATELITELNADPSKFDDIAKEHSDGPSGANGGDLGSWQKGRMVPEFDDAIEQMEVDAISAEPVETDFGYHVMRRNETRAAHYGAIAFIIGTAGPRVPPTVTRDSAATAVIAAEIEGEISSDNFDELAAEHNDFAEGTMFIGAFKEGDPVAPEIFDMIKSLSFDEVGGPLALPVGLAFLKRITLEQRAGAHILVSYSGATNASAEITRTKEEAKAEAERITALCKENPDSFTEYATEHSDSPSAASGGDLGTWFRGESLNELDEAMDDMKVGDISNEPLETEFGYFVLLRNEVSS